MLSVFSRIVLVSVGNVTQELVQLLSVFSRIVLVSVGNVTQELVQLLSVYSGVRVVRSLVFCVVFFVDHCFSLCSLWFVLCIVCPSST
jgi:hypothetical protein